MDLKSLHWLRNPPNQTFDIENHPDLHLGLNTFLISMNSSVDTYVTMWEAILRWHPEDQIPLYDQIKWMIMEITGITSVMLPMCKNSCLTFTWPFSNLDKCLKCNEPKLGPLMKKPYQEFHTILLGPILQALWWEPSSTQRFQYHWTITCSIIAELEANKGNLSSYDDFFHGANYLKNIKKGDLSNDNLVLMLSMDGTQLYAHKASNCWIYIWVIMDLSLDECYKKRHVLPSRFIPSPNKPKNIDSFPFTRLHHLSALQWEGLRIWDASEYCLFVSKLFLGLNTADGPGMVYLNGLVGHHCQGTPFKINPHNELQHPQLNQHTLCSSTLTMTLANSRCISMHLISEASAKPGNIGWVWTYILYFIVLNYI